MALVKGLFLGFWKVNHIVAQVWGHSRQKSVGWSAEVCQVGWKKMNFSLSGFVACFY